MTNGIEIAHRRLLPLTVAALLLAAAAPQLTGGGVAEPANDGVRTAGVSFSLGYHGHWGHHHGHYRHYRPYRYYGYWGWGRYYPYHYPYYRDYGHPRYYPTRFGRLDLNVKPKKTQVFIDGNYVGVADNFDGWPEHLWLEQDSYELILYNPGYETVVRRIEVRPGSLIKVHHEMRPGESIPPEELSAATARAPRYDRGRQRELERTYERARPPEPPRTAPDRPEALDTRPEPARVRISVAPADATVYLDGHFLGVAGEIGERRTGILIEPGEHVIEVVRPGYRSREVGFEAEAGEEIDLEVELDAGTSKAGNSA